MSGGLLRPTDGVFAFPLREVPALAWSPGERLDAREVARHVLGEEVANRFERHVARWDGPEDRRADGSTPYQSPQTQFRRAPPSTRLSADALEEVLAGTALAWFRDDGSVDYLLRDHHMVDLSLVHYATTGGLPSALFHADRHSDWCSDGFLNARRPDQAATWWALWRGLKRPGSDVPVLDEARVFFTCEQAPHESWMSGRPHQERVAVPWFVDRDALHWSKVVAQPGALDCDWVSLDLDDFLPSPQLRRTGGLLRHRGFQRMWRQARVRVLTLSPQFTNGGDRHTDWKVAGRRTAMRRFVDLVLDHDRLARLREGREEAGEAARDRGNPVKSAVR